jgi:hypothetical protein
MHKVKVKTSVKLKAYDIVAEAVENSVRYGYRRSFKHSDKPGEEQMIQTITDAVLTGLCEIVEF